MATPPQPRAPLIPLTPNASTIRGMSSMLVTWNYTPNPIYRVSTFIVNSIPATNTVSTSDLSAIVDGLTPGTSYTFSISASNVTGTSGLATTRRAKLVSIAPDSPASGNAVAGLSNATVSWTSPGYNGGAAITGYTITPIDSNGTLTQTVSTTNAVRSNIVIKNLTAGMPYLFGICATNIGGYSLSTLTTIPVIPWALPSAPANFSITPYNKSAVLTWDTILNNGKPLISYSISTVPPGGIRVYNDLARSSAVLGSLVNGTTYTVSLKARNDVGFGPLAASSVTPTADIIIPPYIPNPGLVAGGAPKRIFAKSGNYISIFAGSNFQNFNYAIPIGAYSTMSSISSMMSLTTGYNKRNLNGAISVVFPQGSIPYELILNNGEEFSGSKTVTYTSSSSESLISGAGGQFSTILASDWTHAKSINFRRIPTPMTMSINITSIDDNSGLPTTIDFGATFLEQTSGGPPSGQADVGVAAFNCINDGILQLPFTLTGSDSITIDWGDSSALETWTVNTNPPISHTYTNTGNFNISITGSASAYGLGTGTFGYGLTYSNGTYTFTSPGCQYITGVTWGTLAFTSISGAFMGCFNMTNMSGTLPIGVTDISYMLMRCSNMMDINISYWDTSAITNMRGLFMNTGIGNGNIALDGWNTSAVTNMAYMFYGTNFLGNLYNNNHDNMGVFPWTTSSVTDMSYMFYNSAYYTNLSRFNVNNVTNAANIFGYNTGAGSRVPLNDSSGMNGGWPRFNISGQIRTGFGYPGVAGTNSYFGNYDP